MASSNVLSFPYVKRQAGPEVLVLRLFSAVDTLDQIFEVDLKLKGIAQRAVGPFDELTLPERAARVTSGQIPGTRAVSATLSQLDQGMPVFFPVAADVPPGQYIVEVAVHSDAPRWLSLSRTTPGLSEKLALSLQRCAF